MSLSTSLQLMSQSLFRVEALEKVSCLCSQGMCSLRELLSNIYGKGSEEMKIYSFSCILHTVYSWFPLRSRCQFLIKCMPHTLSIILILQKPSLQLIKLSLSSPLASRPLFYHFNVVASSAVICFLVMCQFAREVTWDQMLFFTAQIIFKDSGGKESGKNR